MVKSAILLKMEWLTSIRYKVNFFGTSFSVVVAMLPVLIMLFYKDISFFGFESGLEYSMYLVIANAYWCIVESFWDFTFVMRNKMREGILEDTMMLPMNTVQFILGWAAGGIVQAIMQACPLFLLALIVVGKKGITTCLVIVGIEVISSITSFSFAYMLVAIMLYWNEADQVVSMMANITPLLCGLLVPVTNLPISLKCISCVFPFSWALDLIRFYYCGLNTLFPIGLEWCIFFVLMAVYFGLGIYVYRKLLKKARKDGTFGRY